MPVYLKTIQDSMDEMIATLQQQKQLLLAKASELAKEKLGVLDAQGKSLNISLAEVQSLADIVERSLHNASDEELLEMQQQIASGVEEGCRKRQQVSLQPAAEANIGTDMTFSQQALCIVSSVSLSVVDTSKFMIEEADTKAEVNKPAETYSPPCGLHQSCWHWHTQHRGRGEITRGWLSHSSHNLPHQWRGHIVLHTPHIFEDDTL